MSRSVPRVPSTQQNDRSLRPIRINRLFIWPQHSCNTDSLRSLSGLRANFQPCSRGGFAMNSMEVANQTRPADLIYVVEDDPDVSQLIEHNLRNSGYEVSTFFSGTPVVSHAIMAHPSLFLLDIMLPGISGLDLCRQIRQHERLAKTPIIFLSARTQEPDRLQAFDAGGDGYITKPFSPRELIARVRNVLRVQPETPTHEMIQLG